MKLLMSCCLLLLGCTALGQHTVTVSDHTNGKPVYGAVLYDCNHHLVAVSNEKGLADIGSACFPLFITHDEYKRTRMEIFAAAVQLSPAVETIEEVVVTPVNPLMVYEQLLKTSKDSLSKSPGTVSGIYFETVVIIDEIHHDTSIVDKNCLLTIRKQEGKKGAKYELFCSSGEQSFQRFKSETAVRDSAVLNQLLGILPKFASNFKFDLTDAKPFKLDYESSQGRRYTGDTSLLSFSKDNLQHKVFYRDGKILTWNKYKSVDHAYDGGNYFFNFDKSVTNLGYKPGDYQLNSILNLTHLNAVIKEQHFTILLVKGFVDTGGPTVISQQPVEEIESWFEQLGYSSTSRKYYHFF